MSELQIHNSLTGQKEPFQPMEEGKVRMYVCGITVYDYCHMGHGRFLVVFDVVARYLRASGYELTYARNITDVDDKIIKRAAENDEPIDALTERFIEAMNEDADALGVQRPDLEPRATTSMDAIISMVQTLIDKGYGYVGGNGDVYYRVNAFAGYGKLSGRRTDELRVGARIEADEAKDDPLDFVLWKMAKAGEPAWPSPWGDGRPGWHIECSAMSTCCLGDHFDIHGGGLDLQFPHHENEIAQSEAATGQHFANYWMHNGHIRVDGEKMSKSLDNFFTIREVFKQYAPEVIRFFILNSHYRSPLDYSDAELNQAKASLKRLYTAIRGFQLTPAPAEGIYAQRFKAAMDDDFNTAGALAVIFDMAREINSLREKDKVEAQAMAAQLLGLAQLLGILRDDAEAYLRGDFDPSSQGGLADDDIQTLITARLQARQDKNWAEADRIRDTLAEQGVVLEDGAGGTTWRRA